MKALKEKVKKKKPERRNSPLAHVVEGSEVEEGQVKLTKLPFRR